MNNKIHGSWLGRWLCMALVLSLLLPVYDAAATPAESWGYVTVNDAMFRPQPGTTDYIDKLPLNWVAKILGTQTEGGYLWYKVSANSPRRPATWVDGFLRQDVFRPMTAAEQTAYLAGGSGTPVPGATAAPPQQTGYIKITKASTNLRMTPGGATQLQMPVGLILPMLGSPTVALSYTWAYVRHTNGTLGYVRNDCYVYTDAAGNPAPAPAPSTPPVSPTQPNDSNATGYITLIKGGVNLRIQPGGSSIAQLDRGTVLPYYGFAQQGGYTWYYVLAAQGAGYIRSDMAQLSSGGGQPATTPAPTGGVIGYVVATHSGVNLRKTPTTNGEVLTQVARNTVWPMIYPVVNNQGYTWYFVRVNDRTGYLRGDVARQLSAAEVTAYLAGTNPGTTPTPVPTTGGHVITTAGSLNIRALPSLSATQLAQLPTAGQVFSYTETVTSGGSLWYRIVYNGAPAFIMGKYLRVMTQAEYDAWAGNQPVPTPTPTVNPADLSSIAVTRLDRVLVRETASATGKTLTVLYQQGTKVTLLGTTANADGYLWYRVTAGGVSGWIRGDVIRILTKTEAGQLTPTTGPGGAQEASYPTLVRGSTGDAVTRLQVELARLGFLSANAITGVYTTETVEAVKNYQEAAGLFIDGIAGANTQHKLYGTVPVGTYTPPADGTTLYPVEKVDWYTGDIQSVWANGTTAVLTDVKTGLSFRARRWAGAYHADVEPLTAADTAIMCRIYGVTSAQQIAEKNLYQRRPTWVTVGGRSFAASVYGVPHNYPQGDTIKDNDFNGQFCVHFLNSKTHSTVQVDADHMAAIQDAYLKAPSRK